MKYSAAVVVLLAVARATSPASGAVEVTCREGGPGEVVISYDSGPAAPGAVRAFFLDVTVDGGGLFTGYSSPNPAYGFYPGSVSIDAGGSLLDAGSPIASASDYPGKTLPGPGSGGVTIEMVALGGVMPPSSGDLITLEVEGGPFNVVISPNQARGGVVMADPAVAPGAVFGGCSVGGSPLCPCMGDANGDGAAGATDMNALLVHLFLHGDQAEGWLAPVVEGLECLDLDGSGGLSAVDMNVLVTHLFLNGDQANGWRAPCME